MDYPKPIKDLIEGYLALPGIGKKTAERLALFTFSEMEEEMTKRLGKAIINVKSNLYRCPKCHNISETEDLCEICKDETRDGSTVMVVETIKDVFIMEKMDEYKGVYHVLDGSINFAAGVGVEDINIQSLIERVKQGEVKELIIATNATTEGETTARYIKALLDDYDIFISRIAHGLPFGADISYADEMTLLKAIEGRRKY
jgi:recombination protein RecR